MKQFFQDWSALINILFLLGTVLFGYHQLQVAQEVETAKFVASNEAQMTAINERFNDMKDYFNQRLNEHEARLNLR
jgi:hypothetical protein